MPDLAAASSRLYRRLAEGVQRTRLVEPILASRPPLVVICAPSGYGKTVLAAQIAASQPSEQVVWVDCGGGGSIDDDLARLASLLLVFAAASPCAQSAVDACSSSLSSMSDERSMILVLDDAGWASDEAALAVLVSAIAEAPPKTVTIVTARTAVAVPAGPLQVWNLGIEELRLSDSETAEAWHHLTAIHPDERGTHRLVRSSGRHFALLSLLGRNASLMGATSVPERCSPSVSSLLKGLVDGQLDDVEKQILHCAAVLGEGSFLELADVARQPAVRDRLTRVSDVIPLVSVGEESSGGRFVVHDLVSEALGSARVLAEAQSQCIAEAIALLESNGRPGRALLIALQSRSGELLADCVEQTGSRLLKCSSWRTVCEAIEQLPSAVIASRPELLLVKAEAEWANGRRSDAIRQAQLAIKIAELAEPDSVSYRGHALLSSMRMVLGDFPGILADVGPLLEDEAFRGTDEFADVVYAAIAAYGFLGDREGLARCDVLASTFCLATELSPFRLSRIDAARALVSVVLEGDRRTAARLTRTASEREGVPSHWRVAATCNAAAAALEAGDLEGAQSGLEAARVAAGECGTRSDHALRDLLSATLEGLQGKDPGVAFRIDRMLECCEAEGERFTETLTCLKGVEVALCLRQTSYARDLSERGAMLALETGSPVLVWLSELLQAQALLAVGEVDRAGKTAERLLPRVESIAAMGHVLHARLILAEIALRAGDLAVALENIAAVSEHIVEKTPGLVVGSYVRCFPDLLGPLAHVVGVGRIPKGVLRCIAGPFAEEAIEAAAQVLTKSEMIALKARMLTESGRTGHAAQTVASEEPIVEVRLFGGLEVKTARGLVAQRDWGKRKARLLFAMLVARHGTDVHRAELIDYLWPDLDEGHGVNNFYVVWSAMKRAVAPGSSEDDASRPFENHNGVCRIVAGRVVSDLDLFTRAREDARRARNVDDTKAEAAALRTSIELYRGDVLPGDIYDDWFGGVRQCFRQEYQASVIRYATIVIEQGDPLAALPFVIQASERDPLREDLYQIRIRLEVASNQRGAAMGTYMSCRNTLIEELGIDPSRETVALYQQILAMEDGPEISEH